MFHKTVEQISNHTLIYLFEDAIEKKMFPIVAYPLPLQYTYTELRNELFRRMMKRVPDENQTE